MLTGSETSVLSRPTDHRGVFMCLTNPLRVSSPFPTELSSPSILRPLCVCERVLSTVWGVFGGHIVIEKV